MEQNTAGMKLSFGSALKLVIGMLIIFRPAVSIEKCKLYKKPKNGFVVCDSLFRLFCSVECYKGFVFTSKPALVYICGPTSRKWFTYPHGSNLPWPDCIPDNGTQRDNIIGDLTARRVDILRKISATYRGVIGNVATASSGFSFDKRFEHLMRAYEIALRSEQNQNPSLKTAKAMMNQIPSPALHSQSMHSAAVPRFDTRETTIQDISQPRNSEIPNAFNKLEPAVETNPKSFLTSATDKGYYSLTDERKNRESVSQVSLPTKRNVDNKIKKVGDHLFFFPIKRDTLLQLLPKSMRQSYEATKRSYKSSVRNQENNSVSNA